MNKSMLLGRICKDIELKYTSANNTAYCKFSFAVNRKFSKDGEKKADFINVTAWGKQAEFIAKYFSKGSQAVVTGRLETNNWEDGEGKKHYETFINLEEIFFAGDKKGDGNSYKEPSVNQSELGDDELPF